MAHHPAWVGHTGGSRSTPTVHPCLVRQAGCGWLTHHKHYNHHKMSPPQNYFNIFVLLSSFVQGVFCHFLFLLSFFCVKRMWCWHPGVRGRCSKNCWWLHVDGRVRELGMQTANTSETPAVNVDTRQTDDSDGSVHGNIECVAWWWASQSTTAAGDSNRQHAAHMVCRKVDVPMLDLRRLKRLVRHFILKDVTLRVVPATGDIGLRGVKTKCHRRPADASWTQAMRSIPRERVQ